MLKFFRRIRRKFIDEGHFKKYLVYAVGEILLVMIGILLALQVNNWSEQRKTRALTKEYLLNIKNDLEADTASINKLLKNGQAWEIQARRYYNYFENGNWTTSEVIASAQKVEDVYFRYFPINTTFNDLLSSGNSKLLPEQIRRKLIDLKTLQDRLVIILDRNITDKKNWLYELNKFWDRDGLESDFFQKTGILQSEEQLLLGLKYYHLVLFEDLDSIQTLKDSGGEIKRLSNEIIRLIDDEFN